MKAMVNEAAPRQPFFNRQPPIVVGLCGAILLAHLARMFGSNDLSLWLANEFAVVPANYDGGFETWNWPALFGHVFLHEGFVHLAFNLSILFSVSGRVVERMGSVRFLILFFISAAIGALTYVGLNAGSTVGAVGASGAVCGVYAALLLGLRWDWRASIRDPAVLRSAAGFLLAVVIIPIAVRYFNIYPIAWEAHLGGFVAGALLFALLAPKTARVEQ